MEFISLLQYYKYALLVPLAILEGPLLSLFAGFMVRLGYFSFLPTYIIFIFGDLVSDTFYYHIGKIGDESKIVAKYSKKYKVIGENFSALERLWKVHGGKALLLCKLTYGIAIPFIISAGLAKVSYKRFISVSLPVTALKYAVYLFVGYYFAYSYKLAEKYIVLSGIILVVLVALSIYFYKLVLRYLNKETNEDNPISPKIH